MGKSTVTTVAELIAKTKEARQFIESFEAVMRGPKEIRYTYYIPYDTTYPACKATVHSVATPDITFGFLSSADLARYNYYQLYYSVGNFVSENSVKPVMDATFGVKVTGRKKAIVPTYGLVSKKKPDVLKEAIVRIQEAFREYYKEQFVGESAIYTQHAKDFFASPECQAGKDSYRVDEIVAALKRTLVKFKTTDPDIVRRAAEEAIVSLVMAD